MKAGSRGEQKLRAERTLALARALLEEQRIDITAQVDLPPLANVLKERASVSYDTARRHVHRAVMLARGELSKPPQWGGVTGNGGGRPRTREIPPPKTATIKAGNPLHAHILHPGGGYEPIGRGAVEIAKAGAERLVKVDLGDGRTLVLTVF